MSTSTHLLPSEAVASTSSAPVLPVEPVQRGQVTVEDVKLKRQNFYFEILHDLTIRGVPHIRLRKIYDIYGGSCEFRLGTNKTETIYGDLFHNEEYHDSTHLDVPEFFLKYPHPDRPNESEEYQYRLDAADNAIDLYMEDFQTVIENNELGGVFRITHMILGEDLDSVDVEKVLLLPKYADMSAELKKKLLRGRDGSLLRNRQAVSTGFALARARRAAKNAEKEKALAAALASGKTVTRVAKGKKATGKVTKKSIKFVSRKCKERA